MSIRVYPSQRGRGNNVYGGFELRKLRCDSAGEVNNESLNQQGEFSWHKNGDRISMFDSTSTTNSNDGARAEMGPSATFGKTFAIATTTSDGTSGEKALPIRRSSHPSQLSNMKSASPLST